MPEQAMPVTLIKHRGFFNYSALLQSIRGWYVDDVFDVLSMPIYKQKYPTPMGVEHELIIRGEKNVTDYVKFRIDVFLRIFNLRDIEIVHEGKKMKMQDGQVQIEVQPFLTFDWQKRFEGSPKAWGAFLSALDKFYREYIIKYKIADYWEDMILLKASQLARVIREALGQEIM